MENDKASQSSTCKGKTILTKRIEICRSELDRLKAIEFLNSKNHLCMQNATKYAYGLQPYQVTKGTLLKVAEMYCSYLDLPTEVRMLSLETFERFILCSFDEVFNKYSNDGKSYFDKDKYFNQQLQEVFQCAPIYYIACVQIASKFESRDLPLTSPAVTVKFLTKRGYNCNEMDLMEAEMKVLVSMNYDLNIITRYGALEDLISTRRSPVIMQLTEEIFLLGVSLLEMLLKHHRDIFDELYIQLGFGMYKENWHNCSSDLQRAEYDAVWVAASVIVTAIKLLPAKLLSEERVSSEQTLVLKELAEDMCGTRSERELRIFAWVLFVKFSDLDLRKL